MVQINASTVTNTVAMAVILSFTATTTLRADSTMPSSIPSPLQMVGPPLGNGITALSLDLEGYANIKLLQDFDIAGFTLSGNRQVHLRVHQFDVFAEDAQPVVGSNEGNMPLDRPDVVLLSGEVVGAPGSIVFLGLSPHGTHGYIQFPDDMFIISTRAENTVIYSLAALPAGLLKLPKFQCDVIEVVDRVGADTGGNPLATGRGTRLSQAHRLHDAVEHPLPFADGWASIGQRNHSALAGSRRLRKHKAPAGF